MCGVAFRSLWSSLEAQFAVLGIPRFGMHRTLLQHMLFSKTVRIFHCQYLISSFLCWSVSLISAILSAIWEEMGPSHMLVPPATAILLKWHYSMREKKYLSALVKKKTHPKTKETNHIHMCVCIYWYSEYLQIMRRKKDSTGLIICHEVWKSTLLICHEVLQVLPEYERKKDNTALLNYHEVRKDPFTLWFVK